MDRIGKYEIVSVIGRGGMGMVYRARDSVIGRDVALKVINESALNTPDVRERFLREAVSAGRLSHENIATIYDVGEENDRPYIVMEYVEGSDLREMIRPGAPSTAEDKMDVAVQICQALHYAHRRGIIHRDIKPDNIRISSDGRVKILDFGIARITDDTELQTITVTGMSIGTPRYMSPEQIRGERLDPRSDIFSFGVVLYELLGGTPPFTGERVTTLIYKILNVDPEPLEFDPRPISDELRPMVFKCLAKDREQRYADFGEVLRDMQAVLDLFSAREGTERTRQLSATIAAYMSREDRTPVSTIDSDSRIEKDKRPARRGLIAAIVVVVVVALGAAYYLLGSEKQAVSPSVAVNQPSEPPSPASSGSDASRAAGATDDEGAAEAGADAANVGADAAAASSKQEVDPPIAASESDSAPASQSGMPDGAERSNAAEARQPPGDPETDENPSDDVTAEDDRTVGQTVQDQTPPDSRTDSVPAVDIDPAEKAAAAGEQMAEQSVGDASPAIRAREAMETARRAAPRDVSGHPLFVAAGSVEKKADEAYEGGDFDEAANLYRDAEIGYRDAVESWNNLTASVQERARTLDAAFASKDLDRLSGIHPYYGSDYYRNLFAVAETVSATTATSDIQLTDDGAGAVVRTRFVYRNNKNEEIEFSRAENWTFTEEGVGWTLSGVTAQ